MKLEAGANIVMQIPADLYQDTVHFYRDVLLMDVEEGYNAQVVFAGAKVAFGANTLWLQPVQEAGQASVLLEIRSSNPEATVAYLQVNSQATNPGLQHSKEGLYTISDPAGNLLYITSTV